MRCPLYDAGTCRSCTWMGRPYPDQLAAKQQALRAVLAPDVPLEDPVPSPEQGYRNRAKLVVGGSVAAPRLGILDADGHGVDLTGCGLYPPTLTAAFGPLARFVTLAGLTPYDVPTRRGELKYLLVTASDEGRLMVRFVLRSTEALPRLRKHLPRLAAELPGLAVASANLQPVHAAVLEGDREVPLTPAQTMTMPVGGVDLQLAPGAFFQTNTAVAAELYTQVAAWVDELAPARVWDLYCGVGGFALHCARPGREVLGIELSAPAVAAARVAAAGRPGLRFVAGDTLQVVRATVADGGALPDVAIVNPPRRGLGGELTGWLDAADVPWVVYSSCNLGSLASDLAAMPRLVPVRARLLDMFPQTAHAEAVVLLRRARPVHR